jgi:transposase
VGKQKVPVREGVSERLGVGPAKFRVTRRPQYVSKNEDGVIQASAPARIIEGGIPTEALLAQIVV